MKNESINETWDINRIKELAMSRVHNLKTSAAQDAPCRFRLRYAVAAAVITLAFTTTALAATGVIDFKSLFNSVFRNEQVAPYIQTGEDITVHANESDIEIELIAAFVDASPGSVFIELEITDPTGEMLSDSFILFMLDESQTYSPLSLDFVDHVQFIDENTVRAAFSVFHFIRKSIDEVSIRFDMIASGIHFVEMQSTGLNIGELIGMQTPINVPGAEFVEITAVTHGRSDLRITHRKADAALYGWGESGLGLMKPDGEVIWSYMGTYDADMSVTSFNISGLNPDDLVLVYSGTRAERVITGTWEFTISTDSDSSIGSGIFTGEYDGLHTEVEISATRVSVRIYDAPDMNKIRDLVFNDAPVVLYLADGTTVEPTWGGAEGGADVTSISYLMDFINPADVVRITFRGVEIGG